MALLTAGAVVVGLIVVILASGVLSPKATVGTLIKPLRPAPASLVDPTNPRALGKATAPVTVDVWSDFQCPACDSFATTVEPDLIDQYVATGKVRLVYRDFAFIDNGAATGRVAPGRRGRAVRRRQVLGVPRLPVREPEPEGREPRARSPSRSSPRSPMRSARTGRPMTHAWRTAPPTPWRPWTPRRRRARPPACNQTPTLALDGKLLQGGALPMTTLGPAIDALLASASPAPGGSPAVPAASPSPAATAAP